MTRSEWMTKRIVILCEGLQVIICPKVTMPVWLRLFCFLCSYALIFLIFSKNRLQLYIHIHTYIDVSHIMGEIQP